MPEAPVVVVPTRLDSGKRPVCGWLNSFAIGFALATSAPISRSLFSVALQLQGERGIVEISTATKMTTNS